MLVVIMVVAVEIVVVVVVVIAAIINELPCKRSGLENENIKNYHPIGNLPLSPNLLKR